MQDIHVTISLGTKAHLVQDCDIINVMFDSCDVNELILFLQYISYIADFSPGNVFLLYILYITVYSVQKLVQKFALQESIFEKSTSQKIHIPKNPNFKKSKLQKYTFQKSTFQKSTFEISRSRKNPHLSRAS